MDKKNILLIGDSLESGGAAQLLNRTGLILKQNGHNVIFFTGSDLTDYSKIVEPKFKDVLRSFRIGIILKVSFIKSLKHIFKCSYQDVFINIRHFFFPEMKKKLCKLLDGQNFDYAHINNIHGRLSTQVFSLLSLYKIPIITQINDYYFFCNTYYAYNKSTDLVCDKCINGNAIHAIKYGCSQYFNSGSPKIEAFRRIILKLIDPWGKTSIYFVTSRTTSGILQKWGVDISKIHLIKNPFLDSEFDVEISLGNQVIFYGSNLALKGVDVFLESLKYVNKNIQFGVYLMGMSQEYENKLKEITNNRNIKIEIINNISWETGLKDKIAKAACCVVVPSQWWITSENVVYESMFLGKPVIVSDFGGNRELIKDNVDGLYFKVRNPEDLANKINEIAGDRNLNEKLSYQALRKAKAEFNQKVFYNSFVEGLEKIR